MRLLNQTIIIYSNLSKMSQQLKRQKTIDLGASPVWAKIVPLSTGLPAYQFDKTLVVIGRVPSCDVTINDKRLSSKHCQIQNRGDQIILTDLSTNGTYIKDNKIGKGVEVELKNNTQIWLLPPSKVKPTQALGFRFELATTNNEKEQQQQQAANLKKSKTKSKSKDKIKVDEKQQKEKEAEKQKQKQKEKEKEKAKAAEEAAKSKIDTFAQSIKDQITCAFCFEIMHVPVSVQPCNHRFCGACLTQLVKNKKGDCIKCRKQISTAVKDTSFNNIIDDYLKNHPDDKRDPKDVEQMNKKNIFTFDPTDIIEMISGKPAKKKAQKATTAASSVRARGRRVARTTSDLSASDEDEARCRQCMTARNGFQCSSTQRHITCFTCGKLMADRADRTMHQSCILCTQNFCNLYFPPCARSGIKLQLLESRKGESTITAQLLRANKFEFQSLRNYLVGKKLTSKDVFDFVMKKIEKSQFSYIVDRKIMKIPPIGSREVKINADDAVCDLCWKELWFQMVFFYRNQIAADLPPAVRDRPTCYWGVNCRTMDHNDDHAKKYSHMIFQTRF